jgi:hypothetical protein
MITFRAASRNGRLKAPERLFGARRTFHHAEGFCGQGGNMIHAQPNWQGDRGERANGPTLAVRVGPHGQQQQFGIEFSSLGRLSGDACDQALHAPSDGADKPRHFSALAFGPKVWQTPALQFVTEKGADARSREPDPTVLPRVCIEHEHISKETTQSRWVDVGPRRRSPLAAQHVPMREQEPRRGQSQPLSPYACRSTTR